MENSKPEAQSPQKGTRPKPRLIVITGPTGVGKTDLAIKLAERYGGEIISADSMQIYRYMDIGTAKPSSEERLRVPHHLIDVVNPDEEFNASMFVKKADEAIALLHSRHKRVFVVGGTGLYLNALLGGLLNAPGADGGLRDSYRKDAAQYGKGHLYKRLREIDATAAERIHPNDLVRTIRALEVLEHTGQSITEIQGEHRFGNNTYDCVKIGLNIDRNLLYDRINDRVEKMMEAGLVEEVERLMDMGYDESVKPMQSMTYRNVVSYIRGEQSEQDMVRLIKRDTRHYARRQLTWFKRDPDIKWFAPQDENMIDDAIEKF
ncbi:MAG: tRNA (adenosine(37)-N6)-dimethylallyltransferase MiaA, partial [Thermodesulfobacteriota bacterium]|nr:tRNA (adenosine(37)-N6)-dimethylallyltransferase MiaA [Thermodesulfobacteriota bacterium]